MCEFFTNNVFTLHFDNMNALMILEKGSSKFRLQNYALYVDELCLRFKIRLKTVWIPRCLNNVADIVSKMIDYDDYTVQNDFYQLAIQISGFLRLYLTLTDLLTTGIRNVLTSTLYLTV
jgi:hypothetical protein